jgi:hypothetical protein
VFGILLHEKRLREEELRGLREDKMKLMRLYPNQMTRPANSSLALYVFIPRQLIQASNDEVVFEEPVACARRFELVICKNFKRELEAPVKLVLPLLGKAAGAGRRDSAASRRARSVP